MNRPAPLRSPVALLSAFALVCGLLATVLALSATDAHAAAARIGTFTLEPAAGNITDARMVNTATSDAACPTPVNPGDPYVRTGLALPKPGSTFEFGITRSDVGAPLDSGPFTTTLPAGAATLETTLRKVVKTGPLDGTYELRLHCNTALGAQTSGDYFAATIRVTGENWALVQVLATTVNLETPAEAVAGAPLKLTARLVPEAAVGRVSFGFSATGGGPYTEVGTADVAAGKAELTVQAPATAGYAYYRAEFTPTDPEAYNGSADEGTVSVVAATPTATETPSNTPTPTDSPTDGPTEPADLDVTDAEGNVLDANPTLEAGQKVLLTARGYGKDATVEAVLADSEAALADATADADGTVKDYEFTVPAEIEDGDHTLTLTEKKEGGHSVEFAFVTGADATPTPGPSDTSAGDSGGSADGGSAGDSGGGTAGGSDGSGGGGSGSGGPLAATGSQVGAIGLGALALVSLGVALVIHVRRKGLLSFGGTAH
ncbi:hypothetical protein ACFWRV_35475 [Streptomyces sp. NPDC058576]|uniref:hypothetical protein n=1 Tax=Streptomyces sp. NPDC058576 TaxID=3346547 RepID=UPI00364BE432